jgi:outer membrane lipoprotein carrier protein
LRRRLAIPWILLCLVVPKLVGQEPSRVDIERIARAVDRHYNRLQSLTANFIEIYSGGIARPRTESGTLWLKKPGRMRWEYREPKEKLFVTDGKTAWFYVPSEHQARKTEVKKLDDLRSPLRYLLGKTKLQKEFADLRIAPDLQPIDPHNVVLRGVPKGMEDRVVYVWLEVTRDSRIARIIAEELDGSRTEFRFNEQRENVEVANDRFRFRPPAGVEMLETAQLTD